MTPIDIAFSAIKGLVMSTGFLLTLFVGFVLIAGLSKLRKRDPQSAVVRNIAERLGAGTRYLPPDAPRGPADQLHTPELNEQAGRHS